MTRKNSWLLGLVIGLVLGQAAWGQFSFQQIDDFETGKFEKWYKFGQIQVEVVTLTTSEVVDTVAESGGVYALQLKGATQNWYIGGIGKDLNLDASNFSRIQLDVSGGQSGGKIKIELFDDDNNNYNLEQDTIRGWLATKDDKWVVEVPILGKGMTRYSIPFTAFRLENPGSGDGIWNPDQTDGSGGLLKCQFVVLSDKPTGEVTVQIDNIVLTY